MTGDAGDETLGHRAVTDDPVALRVVDLLAAAPGRTGLALAVARLVQALAGRTSIANRVTGSPVIASTAVPASRAARRSVRSTRRTPDGTRSDRASGRWPGARHATCRSSPPKGRTSLRSMRPEALGRDVVVDRAESFRILACREDSPLRRLMVAEDVFHGKLRAGFTEPRGIEPGAVVAYEIDLRTRNHRFRKGHRIMLVQSAWFPLIGRDPQTLVDIPTTTETDYRATEHRVQ